MFYVPNTIRRFKLGVIVADTVTDPVTSNGGPEIGHVVGFDINSVNEVIIKVMFVQSGERSLHPSNLTVID